jgi:hypothetical protein
LPEREYDQLGDRFEARENQLFGKKFEKIVQQGSAAGLESLGQFTPKG